MQFGIFTVGDVTVDPTTGLAPTEAEPQVIPAKDVQWARKMMPGRERARQARVAADLLAQAEHNGAEPVLVSVSRELLLRVQTELNEQLENLPEPNRCGAGPETACWRRAHAAGPSARNGLARTLFRLGPPFRAR